jgi:hypothetical protein
MNSAPRVATILLSTLLLSGCASGADGPSGRAADVTSAALEATGTTFALSDLDTVRGDEFLVLCPYESPEAAEDRLGFAWPDAPDYSQDDSRQSIAFVADGEIESAIELSREDVDFCSDGPWNLLPVSTELTVSDTRDPVSITVVAP